MAHGNFGIRFRRKPLGLKLAQAWPRCFKRSSFLEHNGSARKKTLLQLHISLANLVLAVEPQRDLSLLDAITVLVEVKLEPIKVSLQYNKLVHNVMVMVKKLLTLVMIVTDREKIKHLRKYL